jgi:predicted DNA-binding transcriptional regulator
MSKDQAIGGAILAVCIIVAVGYVLLITVSNQIFPSWNLATVQLDAVLVLVSVAFIAILAIGAWIGWTMATTPPPKPIEEITTEMEEKKEEAPAAPAPEQQAAPASAAPAPEKKKKNA